MRNERGGLRKDLDAYRLQWRVLSFYERFEQIIAYILSAVVSVIIVVSLWQLIRAVAMLLMAGALNPLDHETFQSVFGMVMTLLIAMEFKHSITRVMVRRDHIVQVKTVILIALLAIARKFIILDPATPPAHIAALAAALVALGIVYWLMRQRDDPVDAAMAEQGKPAPMKAAHQRGMERDGDDEDANA